MWPSLRERKNLAKQKAGKIRNPDYDKCICDEWLHAMKLLSAGIE